MLGIEPQALHVLSKCLTMELSTQPGVRFAAFYKNTNLGLGYLSQNDAL